MKDFKPCEIIEGVDYNVCFWYEGHIGSWGYTFACDKDGVLKPFNNPDAAENYRLCLTGEVRGTKVVASGVLERPYRYKVPASGTCECGNRLELPNFTNTCECGRDYNSSGQELAPRSQWGWDTGESLSDILQIP